MTPSLWLPGRETMWLALAGAHGEWPSAYLAILILLKSRSSES